MASTEHEAARRDEGRERRSTSLLLRKKDHLGFLRLRDIDWLQADGNYTRIHAGKTQHLVRRGIGDLEAQLDRDRFVRISRSMIVNLERIDRLVPWFSGGYLVRLSSGAELKLTRRYAYKLFAVVGRPL